MLRLTCLMSGPSFPWPTACVSRSSAACSSGVSCLFFFFGLFFFFFGVGCCSVASGKSFWHYLLARKHKHVFFKWATSHENVSSESFDQVRLKLACSVTETARILKHWIKQVYILYYLSSEQQSLISTFVVCIWHDTFSHDLAQMVPSFLLMLKYIIIFLWQLIIYEPRQANLCLRAFCHDKFQLRMPSHSEGPGIWLSVWRFLLTQCLYERAAEVLARLRGCAGSPEPSLIA